MELTKENYHSVEQRKIYMGASQFKDFKNCEKQALAKVNGEVEEKTTDALLFGSYVDAYFSKELDEFTQSHPEMFNSKSKTGELKSNFQRAKTVISAIENDEMMLKYLSGEHQVIMTGVISGVPFKIKIDSYFPGKIIVDQKVMKDLEPIWIEQDGKNVKVNIVEAWGYQYQGAIYQEIVYQNTGLRLPFVLAITTKEEVPNQALLQIDQEDLDKALAEVKELAPRFDAIKKGEIEPTSCGKCDYCKSKKKVTGIFSFHTLDPYKLND